MWIFSSDSSRLHLKAYGLSSVGVALSFNVATVSKVCSRDACKVDSSTDSLTFLRRQNRGQLLIFSRGVNPETRQNKRAQEQ
jgi:hypothetical protein